VTRSLHVLDDSSVAALDIVRADGLTDSEAVRTALREAAARRRVRSSIREEVRRLAADEQDREERRVIREQMAELAPSSARRWSAARSFACRHRAARVEMSSAGARFVVIVQADEFLDLSTTLVAPNLDERATCHLSSEDRCRPPRGARTRRTDDCGGSAAARSISRTARRERAALRRRCTEPHPRSRTPNRRPRSQRERRGSIRDFKPEIEVRCRWTRAQE
jgi:hypothetical protein